MGEDPRLRVVALTPPRGRFRLDPPLSCGAVSVLNRQRHRVGVLLLAAFQLAVASMVPIADAMLEIATNAPLHVESERDASCGDGHSHAFCQLCRTLSLAGVARSTPRVCHATESTPFIAERAETLSGVSAFHLAGPIGPRAPPLA